MEYCGIKYHFRPHKGWINDPNGLVYFNEYYHIFYQYSPNFETPDGEGRHWGHARTKDFLSWEELPVALFPDCEYDKNGCWSGTAVVKDDILYLFYSGIRASDNSQVVCVAYSKDGINFEKYEKNPIINNYPADGGPDFRDPAVCTIDGMHYLVMATGNPETKKGRLLLYKSENLFDWQYQGIMSEWDNCHFTECPSLVPVKDGKYLLTASVCPVDKERYFAIMYGDFKDGRFNINCSAEIDKGPDQYAGQVFADHLGRNILISWMPGWDYIGYADKDIGCMSTPREITVNDGKIRCYPVEEIRHLLKDSDECVNVTADGFVIERSGRTPVVYKGGTNDIKIMRDSYIVEVFINGGEQIYSALL